MAADVETADIRDIKGPVGLYNLTYLYVVLAIIAVIILIVLIVRFLKKRRRPQETFTPPRPAHEIAYEALKELMNRDYLRTGKVREYYFELSDIVRHYIEDRFQMKAPEMTTEEFLATLKYSGVLNNEQKGDVRDFLSHCDMVKFAKYLPDQREIELSYESAKKLVDGTKETAVQEETAK
jgi:transglutaminase-like putative cysteine protease